jgi:CRP-like cAMP-binding protein
MPQYLQVREFCGNRVDCEMSGSATNQDLKDEPEKVLQKISQETLAEMIGTTRSRVNFFMNKFRKLGFIEYNGKIVVNKSLLKIVLHE